MCLIVLASEGGAGNPARGRGEPRRVLRPARGPAAWWADAPGVLAGRDLKAGGTWLGVTREGRFAALTNFRDAKAARRGDAPSRGKLVSDFLRKEEKAADYVSRIQPGADSLEGFNLLLSDGDELWSLSNVEKGGPAALSPGVYGLSNHLLETPWPKVVTARERLERALAEARGLEFRGPPSSPSKKSLSRPRHFTAGYRASAGPGEGALGRVRRPSRLRDPRVDVHRRDGPRVRFVERTFGPGGVLGEVREEFALSATPRA